MNKRVYIINMITILIIFIIAIGVFFIAVVSRIKNDIPTLFNHTFHIVLSDSMEPEINTGDFVLAKRADVSEVETGDYVIFVSPDPALRGIVIIHKVIEINTDDDKILLTTMGIKEGATPDAYPVEEIIGIYRGKSVILGRIISVMSNLRNLLFLSVFIAAIFFAVKYSLNIINIAREKKEDNYEKQDK